jgi:hypothetical protein
MNIRITQGLLFETTPVERERERCSLGHRRKATSRIYFKNGNTRDVCSGCVKKFRKGGKYADKVERIEPIKSTDL